MKRVVFVLAAAGMLGGCGLFDGKGKPTTPTVGQRIPVLSSEAGLEVDPALASVAVAVPPASPNEGWPQPGGSASKSIGHVSLGATPARAWMANIGAGSDNRARLAAGPVIGDGRVYTIDTQANVRAFNATTGAPVWAVGVGAPKDRQGGISILSG